MYRKEYELLLREDKRYKDLLNQQPVTRDDLMRLPHHVPSSYRNRFEQKTENVISIIKNCEYLKEEYVAPQYEWTKSIDLSQDTLKDDHRQLKQLSKGKRMFYLRPHDQDMFKKVITGT